MGFISWIVVGLIAGWLALLAPSAAHAQDTPPPASAAPQTLPGTGAPSAPDTAAPTTQTEQAPPADAAPVEFKPGMLEHGAETGVTSTDLGIVDGAPVGTLMTRTADSGRACGPARRVRMSKNCLDAFRWSAPIHSCMGSRGA